MRLIRETLLCNPRVGSWRGRGHSGSVGKLRRLVDCLMKGLVLTTLAGGGRAGVTLTVLKVGSWDRLRVLANKSASNQLNWSDHF